MGLFNTEEQTDVITLDVPCKSDNFANQLGTFIRTGYMTLQNAFQLAGISGTYREDGKQMENISSSTIFPGNKTVYELFSGFASANLKLDKYAELKEEETVNISDNLKITRLSDSIFVVDLSVICSTIKSDVFGDLCDKNITIIQDFDGKEDAYDIQLYYKYGIGRFESQDLGIEFTSLGVTPVTMPVLCQKNGNIGYEANDTGINCQLSLFYTKDVITEADIRKNLVDIRNIFDKLIEQLN